MSTQKEYEQMQPKTMSDKETQTYEAALDE